jgi:hypothetical protein
MRRWNWWWRWLCAPVVTAGVTVALGAAVNRIFAPGGLLWPWVAVAIIFALAQAYISSMASDRVLQVLRRRVDANGTQSQTAAPAIVEAPVPPVDGVAAIQALRERVCERALAQIPFRRSMPIAWKLERSNYDDNAEATVMVSGADKIAQYFLSIPSRRMVILGGPGSGKTVLAWRIAREIIEHLSENESMPVVIPIGSWNPFEDDFLKWLKRQVSDLSPTSETRVDLARVLPILDGFDEFSTQLRAQALGVLDHERLANLPLIIVSRSEEFQYSLLWRHFVTGAAIIELQPIPREYVVQYLEGLPRGDFMFGGVNTIIRMLTDDRDGVLAQVLSSPFMLDIAGNSYVIAYPHDLFEGAESGEAARVEDVLARSFARARIARTSRWQGSDVEKWMKEIAKRTHYPFDFRPNELDLPAFLPLIMIGIAAALPCLVIALAAVGSLHLLLVLALVAAHGFGLTIWSTHVSGSPVLDPRVELSLARSLAVKKVGAVLASTLFLGGLTLLVPYARIWVIGLGALLLGIFGLQEGEGAWKRLVAFVGGVVGGAALGTAAYIGATRSGLYPFVLVGSFVGGLSFLFILIVNFVSHVSGGEGRQGMVTAPIVATIFGLPLGLFGGCVVGATVLSRYLWHLGFAGSVAGLLAYSAALALGFLLLTEWTAMGLRRISYALAGIFPLRLLDFLEDFAEGSLLRRRGYSYEFRHPAILRIYQGESLRAQDEGKNPW